MQPLGNVSGIRQLCDLFHACLAPSYLKNACARGRTRTGTPLRAADFESAAATITPLGLWVKRKLFCYLPMDITFKFNVPAGTFTWTNSPTSLFISALPIGEFTEIFPFSKSASSCETIW